MAVNCAGVENTFEAGKLNFLASIGRVIAADAVSDGMGRDIVMQLYRELGVGKLVFGETISSFRLGWSVRDVRLNQRRHLQCSLF